jgi:Uma2 family endonuclease
VTIAERYQETIPVPRAIRLPVELIPPEGFDPEDPRTWPQVEGRLEFVNGRLLFMPPCGELQSYTVADVVAALLPWVRAHGEFVLGTNEAGMLLHGDARGADAGIWRRSTEGSPQARFHRRPPVLAVEVAGEDEDEAALREKAAWYLGAGVEVVWIVLPEQREVVAITAKAEQRCGSGDALPPPSALPDLTPAVDEFFVQIDARPPK